MEETDQRSTKAASLGTANDKAAAATRIDRIFVALARTPEAESSSEKLPLNTDNLIRSRQDGKTCARSLSRMAATEIKSRAQMPPGACMHMVYIFVPAGGSRRQKFSIHMHPLHMDFAERPSIEALQKAPSSRKPRVSEQTRCARERSCRKTSYRQSYVRSVRLCKHFFRPPARVEAVLERLEAAYQLLQLGLLSILDVARRRQRSRALGPRFKEGLDESGALGNVLRRQRSGDGCVPFRFGRFSCSETSEARLIATSATVPADLRIRLTMFVKVFEIVSFSFGELDRKPNCQHRHSAGADEDDESHLDHLIRKVGQLSDVDTERLIADAGQDFVQQGDVLARQRVRIRLDVRNDMEVLDVRNLLRQRSQLVEMRREEDRGSSDRGKVSARGGTPD